MLGSLLELLQKWFLEILLGIITGVIGVITGSIAGIIAWNNFAELLLELILESLLGIITGINAGIISGIISWNFFWNNFLDLFLDRLPEFVFCPHHYSLFDNFVPGACMLRLYGLWQKCCVLSFCRQVHFLGVPAKKYIVFRILSTTLLFWGKHILRRQRFSQVLFVLANNLWQPVLLKIISGVIVVIYVPESTGEIGDRAQS